MEERPEKLKHAFKGKSISRTALFDAVPTTLPRDPRTTRLFGTMSGGGVLSESSDEDFFLFSLSSPSASASVPFLFFVALISSRPIVAAILFKIKSKEALPM